jgi:hypothetical protein
MLSFCVADELKKLNAIFKYKTQHSAFLRLPFGSIALSRCLCRFVRICVLG